MTPHQRIIKHKGKIIALIFKKTLTADGVKFLTPESYSLQLGLIEHSAGKIIRDYQYNPKIKYKIESTQEFIFVQKGKIKAKFFSDSWKLVAEEILTAGDFLLHISGGHGFEVLRKCRLIEIKQGPFPGKKLAKLYPKS